MNKCERNVIFYCHENCLIRRLKDAKYPTLNPDSSALHSGCLWPVPTNSHLVPEVELSVKITNKLKQAAALTPLYTVDIVEVQQETSSR